ncbi:MAG: hypothetical protein KDE27_02680, partial [Planctomycetes bacterium]|nr:hypothetical protein [Planctomycetota bacterium]
MTKAARLWLLIPALLAVAWFWPVLSHGFRSDDFLTVYYYDRDAGAVHWGRVLEEWVRPWFGVRDLYRPLVSFTFGVNWAASTAPSGFHLLNLLLFAGTVAFVALAAARLVPQRPLLAGFAAGLVVVLHPAAVEPTAWVAARTTGLQVFFSTLAYWTFLRWRDGDGRAIVPLLAVGLACASKEGAVLLPFSLLALDLVRGADRPRWRTHLPFFALVAGYLLWRRALLGVFTTAGASQTLTERAANAATLLQQLVAPPLAPAAWTLTALAVLAAVALANRRRAFWCLPWLAGLLLPGTTHVVLHDGELAGRFVFDAVPALALLVAIAFARAERWRTVIAVLAGLVALGALAVGGRAWLQRYDGDDDTVASAQRALLTAAADAAPGRPFGVTGLPDLPVLQPPLWGFLTQRPFADRDLPVVGLANVLTRNEVAPAVYGNAVALHALVTDGAGVGLWDLASRTVRPAARATSDVVELLRDA